MKAVGRLVLAGIVLWVSACDRPLGPATATPTAASLDAAELRTAAAADYPRVDGSTSAEPLQMIVACTILGRPCEWTEALLWDSTRRYGPNPLLELPADVAPVLEGIRHSGTHSAYVNLIDGQAEFILVAREPSADEWDAARAAGVGLDIQPVALDAFVFLVNAGNPVQHLPLETLRDIYLGTITDWQDLPDPRMPMGEEGTAIHTYSRNPNSGSQELMGKLIMRGQPMVVSPDLMLETMMGPVMALTGDPFGIGYSVYFYAAVMTPHEAVKLLGVDGVLPTSAHIGDRSYPLTTEVYAVVRDRLPEDHPARLLRDWLLTPEGQAAVAAVGYVPIGG
jgi:phosphate transport system substrate-binding protein